MNGITIIAFGLAWFGVLTTAMIAWSCVPDPKAGMAKLNHEIEQLPNVMFGRYIAFFGFSAFVVYYADMVVITAWMIACAFMALFDAWLYARQGKKFLVHLFPGVLTIVAIFLMVAAMKSNGIL